MRKEDWVALGESIRANAEMLETVSQADEDGVSRPEMMTKGMVWLISRHLVDDYDGQLHPSSLLIDLGARIASQHFELSAPDLEELLIKIEQGCERYHAAKELPAAELEREWRKIWLAVRQIVTHLRDEQRAATEFIEARYGYSPRFEDRLREISHAMGRLQRLALKLELAEYNTLTSWCRGDRALRRLLLGTLHASVMRQRAGLGDLIGRLDQLGVTVRKRNRLRQVAQSLVAWLQAGNAPDLGGLLDRSDGADWVRATPIPSKGCLYPSVEDSRGMDEMARLILTLPLPKVRKIADGLEPSRAAVKVVPSPVEVEDAPVPFAQPHFARMLGGLKATGMPQSAHAYWREQGEKGCQHAVWLYALDAYYRTLLAEAKRAGTLLRFTLEPVAVPASQGFDNLVVVDLMLRLRARGETA